MRGIVAGVAVLALALGAIGCTAGSATTGPAPDGSGAPVPVRNGAVLIDADSYGAIVLDLRSGEYRGVTRDATIAWRVAAEGGESAVVACLAQCPDAVLSGRAAIGSPDLPDPAPQFVVGGQRRAVAATDAVKRQVLAATGETDLVLTGGDRAAGWWLEIRHGMAPPLRIPVGSLRTSWQASADNRWALAVTELPDASVPRSAEARWFTRGSDGWRRFGAAVPVTAAASCLSPQGDQALLIGAAPALLLRAGTPRIVTDLRYASACGFAATGGIIAEYGQQGGGGVQSRLLVFDGTGAVVWQGATRGEAAVTADPTTARVAYVADGELHELDPSTGAAGRVVADVLAARYDRSGGVVVVRAGGQLEWLP